MFKKGAIWVLEALVLGALALVLERFVNIQLAIAVLVFGLLLLVCLHNTERLQKFRKDKPMTSLLAFVLIPAFTGFLLWCVLHYIPSQAANNPKPGTDGTAEVKPASGKVAIQSLSDAQMTEIVQKIIERYQKRHNNAEPALGYINQRLQEQGQKFRVASVTPEKTWEFSDTEIKGFNIGVVDHSHNITMDGKSQISGNRIGVYSDNPNLNIAMHDKSKMNNNGIAIDDNSKPPDKKSSGN